MTYTDAINRVADLDAMLQQAAGQPVSTTQSESAGPASGTSFASALNAAAAASPAPDASGDPGERALQVAETQVGQSEQPPGSNDGPAIVTYRSAVQGAYPGAPWCAYFVSWCASQAGAPLGDAGQGFGSVAAITEWAARTGRLTSTPAPGDLILFGDRHVGIVESVNGDGSLTTIEGNASNAVSREHHQPGEATGFVRL